MNWALDIGGLVVGLVLFASPIAIQILLARIKFASPVFFIQIRLDLSWAIAHFRSDRANIFEKISLYQLANNAISGDLEPDAATH